MMRKCFLMVVAVLLMQGCKQEPIDVWSVFLHFPDGREVKIFDLPKEINSRHTETRVVDRIKVALDVIPGDGYHAFDVSATPLDDSLRVYISLRLRYSAGTPYNFLGEVKHHEIFRQSPHDVNAWIVEGIAEQAVPVAAVLKDSVFVGAISDSPAFYKNFTSQTFNDSLNYVEVSSGDNGKTPGLRPDTVRRSIDYNTDKTQVMSPGRILPFYHYADPNTPHTFRGLVFSTKGASLKVLRKDVNMKSAVHFSKGVYKDYFGALSFTTAYMNLRHNETGKSKYWVVPAVEYANVQYCRDAFWISTMLPPHIAAECLKNEISVVNNYAEYPLVSVIWAYRAWKENKVVLLRQVQDYVHAIEQRARDGYFYSYLESDGRLDFQYWGDVMAFEKDDVVTYNQGMFAVALAAAREMGIETKTSPELAREHYRGMFDEKMGYFPISRKKAILGPDPLVPDLISQLYMNKKILASENVRMHYERMMKFSKTPFGFKIVSSPTGEYLPSDMYDIPGYVSQVNREKMPDGRYFRGGSYFLYDNLFLIDAFLHGVKEAEETLRWRVNLDFREGSTTYECLNTKTGEPWKPNMGWNVAVYSFWKQVTERGLATDQLFREVDSNVN